MEHLLFINNACVRGDGKSRTLGLCRTVLSTIRNVHIDEVRVDQICLSPLSGVDVEQRERLAATGDFAQDLFSPARQFAAADRIVVGAPYWDRFFSVSCG